MYEILNFKMKFGGGAKPFKFGWVFLIYTTIMNSTVLLFHSNLNKQNNSDY